MHRYEIYINGKNYKRISKPKAEKLLKAGAINIYVTPCKLHPRFAMQMRLDVMHYRRQLCQFEYYNCTPETGKYITFWEVSE